MGFKGKVEILGVIPDKHRMKVMISAKMVVQRTEVPDATCNSTYDPATCRMITSSGFVFGMEFKFTCKPSSQD